MHWNSMILYCHASTARVQNDTHNQISSSESSSVGCEDYLTHCSLSDKRSEINLKLVTSICTQIHYVFNLHNVFILGYILDTIVPSDFQ